MKHAVNDKIKRLSLRWKAKKKRNETSLPMGVGRAHFGSIN